MDFLKSPKELAAIFEERKIKADHAFFFSYIQPAPKNGGGIWSAIDELVKVNSKHTIKKMIRTRLIE